MNTCNNKRDPMLFKMCSTGEFKVMRRNEKKIWQLHNGGFNEGKPAS
jgi:hypothetical protein